MAASRGMDGLSPVSVTAYFLIAGAAMAFSLLVRARLKSTYSKWGRIRNAAGITGGQAARAILDANGLQAVRLQAVAGQLSDHYDPKSKTIRLSEGVYEVPSVAAAAIAAHEAGHAIQDKIAYKPLALKTTLIPLANLGARFGIPAAILGSIIGSPMLVQVGVLGYAGALLLQFLALPVEFDASKRALGQLEQLRLISDAEKEQARSVLRAAALTYVAGAASSAAYLLYLGLAGGRWLFGRPLPR